MSIQLTVLAPLLAVLIWSGNFIAAKISVDAVAPEAMAFYRAIIAVLALAPFKGRSIWKHRASIPRHLPKLAGLGFLGMSLYQGLLYAAAGQTTATNMGIITSTIPLITIVLSWLLLNERASRSAIFAGALSLAGLLIVLGKGHPEAFLQQGFNVGDGLIIIASGVYALYGVLLRRWTLPVELWESLLLQSFFGMLFLLPVFLRAPRSPITSGNCIAVIYAGLAASVMAPYLWMKGVQEIGPNRTSIFMNLLPIFTGLIASKMLQELPHVYDFVGGTITIIGVLVAQNMSKGATSGISPSAKNSAS